MPASDYLEGIVFGGLTLAAVVGGAALLRRRRFSHLEGATAIVAFAMLVTLGLVAVHLVPAMLTVLARGTVLAAAAVWLLGAFLTPAAPGEEARESTVPEKGSEGLAGRIAAGAALVILAAFLGAVLRDQLVIAPASTDPMNFHLPGVASWIQTGSIWQIDVYLAQVSPGHYPNTGDVLLLAAVLPWRNDFLAHLALYPYWPLLGVAGYALARELRVPRAAAILSACLLVAVPAVSVAVLLQSLVDVVMLFGFAAGILFLLRHHRNGRTGELVLAGLSLGIAFGTKWYGVSCVAIVVVVWAAARYFAGRSPGEVLRQLAAVIGLVAASGGVWMLRNLVESANPVFPVKVAPLGVTLFDAPPDPVRERAGSTIADYLDQPAIWADYILPQYRDALALAGAVIIAGALIAAVIVAVPRLRRGVRPPRPRLVAVGLVCAALITVAYSITPYTAGGAENEPVLVGADSRYWIPAFVIVAAVAGWAFVRARWLATAFAVLGVAGVVDAVAVAGGGEVTPVSLSAGDWALGAGLVALAAAAIWAWWRFGRVADRRVPAVVMVAGAALLAIAIAAGHEMQQRYNDYRYRSVDAAIDRLVTEAPAGHRVGLAGAWSDDGLGAPLPAFGPRYENDVAYVGDFSRDVYEPYPDEEDFVAALRRGGFDYLLVGRGRPPRPEVREERWARDAGFEEIARSYRLILLRAQAGAS